MWISLNIISKITNISGIPAEELAHRLTMSTAEIESIHRMNEHFRTIVTAKILEVKKHPGADKLTLVDLDTGSEKLRVVCGAPNHKTGDIVALAKTGTKFSEEFVIKKSKIRGEESNGMLCSEKELGLSDDHSGIMILPSGTPLGKSLAELFPDWIDTLLEIDNKSITHRPDLWSHAGIAREIGALFGRPVKNIINEKLEADFKNTDHLKVTIKCPDEAPRYTGLVVKNIKIAESPEWLKAKVTAIGMRPISNIVDITNYVMSEIGEPMHAFDRKKLAGDEIIVRMAKDGEKMNTLDGREHTLCAEDIVISDKSGPIALAGVMGGGNSEIEDSTSEIVLEAANFNAVNVRKTAHRYNLPSDASMRFEKSQSPELTRPALLRCYELIKQIIPEAEAVTHIVDNYPKKLNAISISTTTSYIRHKLGHDVSDARIIEILKSLEFGVEATGENLIIQVPHYRATKDISIEADIVEEVGRVYGYDNINQSSPLVSCKVPVVNETRQFERLVKSILTANYNMTEVTSYSFTGEDALNMSGINSDKELRLRNPLSQDQDRLRRTLLPNMLKNIWYNHRYSETFAMFELGRVYKKDDRKSKDLIAEERWICGSFYIKNANDDLFFYAKNAGIGLLETLKVKNLRYKPATENLLPYMHPGRTLAIEINDEVAGHVFELHPKMYKKFDFTGKTALFDINMETVMTAEKAGMRFTELPKFPDVTFEISVLADKYAYIADIHSVIEKSNREFIRSIDVISVYEGAPVPEGIKSVSFKIIFNAKDSTLSPEQIEKLQKNVVNALSKSGYKLR
ncbi:MAG: phenylalanine--tRNA ligase subunit beta [Spirochaetes bacterium]|nr:phenylalanine--tRNA ligase subunit beta [Spirochaetota bacterium]